MSLIISCFPLFCEWELTQMREINDVPRYLVKKAQRLDIDSEQIFQTGDAAGQTALENAGLILQEYSGQRQSVSSR